MDRIPGNNNEHLAGSNMFGDTSQYNAYDNLNLYQNHSDSNFNDASWGLNASDFSGSSRAHQSASTWPQSANHLAAHIPHQGYSGDASSYARTSNASPAAYNNGVYAHYGTPPSFGHRDQQKFDPALVSGSFNAQQHNFGLGHFNQQSSSSATIAPQTLEHGRSPAVQGNPYAAPGYQNSNPGQPRQDAPQPVASPARLVDEEALAASIPKGQMAGIFSIVSFDDLTKATSTQRFSNYVNVGKDRQEWRCNRSALPTYVPRKSRKELRELAGKNLIALARIGKKPSKEKTWSMASRPAKPQGIAAISGGSPQTKAEDTSSEEDSDADDDYSDNSEDDTDDSPLPSKKPEDPRGSIRYDTIKALWRSSRKEVENASFKQALVDFWEVVKTIRDRWKADSTALLEAEERKRLGELPLLKSRVKDQRDMMEVAFRTALEHGHRGIVELLAENESLLFVCYQFLYERYKAEDLNSSLTLAILETMSTFTTLTSARLEKTRVGKVLSLYAKKGNAKTQHWAKKVIANSAVAAKNAASKDGSSQKAVPPTAKETPSANLGTNALSPPAKRAVDSVVGMKRAASTAGDANPAKKVAMGASKANGTPTVTKTNTIVKKPTMSASTTSTGSATTAPVPRKTVATKPSGFFSSLNSAAKKPGTSIADKPSVLGNDKSGTVKAAANTSSAPKPAFSFAETMAKLSKPKEEKPAPKTEKEIPNETPQARAKRLRKEARRKLSVRFAADDALVQIRFFTHDPEEEINHDASQMRDVSDVGGEGRMFKQQHQKMDVDDEEEAAEVEASLVEFRTPSLVDFSVVDAEERERNYAPYGGGELKPKSPESVERERYEDSHLVEIYTDASQIPADPREPAHPHTGSMDQPTRSFGVPDEQFLSRARAIAASRNPSAQPGVSGFDMTALSGLMNRPQPPPAMAPPAPAPAAMPDIQQILATLQSSGAIQPPQPNPSAYTAPFSQPNNQFQPSPPPLAPQPSTNGIDLQAILRSLQANNPQSSAFGAPAPNMASSIFAPSSGQQPANLADGGPNKKADGSHPFYKTKICRFWQEGRCQKGDSCTYLHEEP